MTGFALHGDQPAEPVLGRLVARGLHDELQGSAYVVVEGVDGRTHHLTFSDLELTGDAQARRDRRDAGPMRTAPVGGGCRSPPGPTSRSRRRSPRPARPGSTASFSRRSRRSAAAGSAPTSARRWTGRVDHLVEEGLARRQGQRVIFARDLINTLRRRELEERRFQALRRRPASPIARPPRASMSRASTASASRSRPAASP